MLEHIEDFVDQRGREFQHQGRECGVAAQGLELCQVLDSTLASLASQLEPVILVNPRRTLRIDAKAANQS